MATQLLFYEAAVPVSAARHGDCSIEPRDYSFSKSINSVPLTAIEFPAAAVEYSIVFAGQPGAVMPAAILGVRSSENLFLNAKGGWDAKYVPAFVRRYPFVFSSSDQGKTFTLCVDETFAGFNKQGRGQKLFTDDKKPSPYTENVLKFLQQYQMEFHKTQAFCRKVEELKLLEPMQAQIGLPSGERVSLGGFMAVDRNKLKALPGDKLAELAKTDELELIYLHLQSMRNFGLMREKLGSAPAQPAGDTAPPTAAAAKAEDAKPKKK
jgi:hypothetical protein